MEGVEKGASNNRVRAEEGKKPRKETETREKKERWQRKRD